ncbi:MAG: hypothetical protein IT190_09070 [Microbacteriaceae bacterium]|nr:hypothetical protein [Microbacteriaceae bacterium]
MPAGTLTVADLQSNRFQSAAEFGLSTIQQVLEADLAAYNQVVDAMLGDLATPTTDRQRIYGASASGEMYEADEFDRAVGDKAAGGTTVGFPLKKFTKALGWTRDYFLQATPADIAESMLSIQAQHTRAMRREIQRAIFTGTNTTFRDRFVSPQIDLAVKAFVNADSAEIPNGPNGETFTAASHTHYDFLDATSPTAAALLATVNDVVEHGHGGMVKLNINRAAEDAVRALSGFTPYADPRMVYRTADTPGTTLDISRLDNRPIGLLGAAEVWVRSWVPSGYAFAYDASGELKPLAYRQHPVAGLQGLRIAARLEDYPLYADQMESYFGFGVWNRTNGAVLYWASGAVAYVAPTFS